MARLVRYRPNLRGLKALRSSRSVDADLERRAQRIATAAEAFYGPVAGANTRLPPSEDVYFDVLQDSSDTNEPRARVAIIMRHPRAIRIEEDYRILGGSLDAARG